MTTYWKRFINCSRFVAIVLVICFTTSVAAKEPTSVERYGQLRVEGPYLKGKDGSIVTLRGQSFGWSTWWPQYWNADVVKWLVDDWKIDIVRAAMGVDEHPGYLSDPVGQTSLVKGVVDAAIENGVYVLIDWHAHNRHLDAAIEFFTAMAKEYGQYPNVLYELYNEPVNDSWADIKAYSDTLIKIIRQYDPNNIIIATAPYYAQKLEDIIEDPLTGHSNIMYSLHFYADGHRASLRNKLQLGIDHGLPVFVTESSGMYHSGDGPINYPEWWAYIDLMEENHISWINWSISDKRETCSVLTPNASAFGEWTDDELNESGHFIRWLFRSYRVPTVRVESVTIPENMKNLTIAAGDSLQLSASVSPSDATNSAIVWRSIHPDVAEVSNEGMITAKRKGKATITAISQDAAFTESIVVKVMK
jgi:endoglucanase